MVQEKKCSYCHTVKDSSQFYKRKHGAYLFGVDHICKQCYSIKRAINKERNAEYRKQHYEQNKALSKEQCKAWRDNNKDKNKAILANARHKRRALEKNGNVSTKDLRLLIKNSNYCYWCKIPLNGIFHIDHYYPLSKGGLHSIENLVISCPSCNLSKGSKDPLEFSKQI